ncbi:DNA-binding transcriptional regulator, LysR family [Kosakonia arachidis]|uniref:DNA-binding transcriptional regulator, LysR family n=2 Tax=Kosakonia arachidis TaxID=551989 RepID=A0A1I7ARD8_9ENTR|nr:LysR family transcriptional regulator [Kosakonia arachidis]SFT77477.1 DNA-binding transcriptional regulator, LysR family [Kosakonia arachidis]
MSVDGRQLSNISVLAAIVHSGSFARAAESLNMSASGVSRAVTRLETSIGVRLFDRTTRAVKLTDEGRRLYEEISPLLAGISDAISLTSGASTAVTGRLRVNVDPFFSRHTLAPTINAFMKSYPGISVEIVARDQLGDLVSEGFDIAVRFGNPPVSSLIARRLLEVPTKTVASPEYIQLHGKPETPADLIHHSCIQVRSSMTGQPLEWEYALNGNVIPVKISSRLMVNDSGTLIAACVAGAGIARIKASGIEDLLAEGRLVELLTGWEGERFPLYALYPSRRLPPAKVRAFVDFVSRVLERGV